MVMKLRYEHKLKARDLARIINTTTSFVGNVENLASPAKYNMKHINAFAIYFQVSPQIFFPEAPFEQ